MSVCVYSVMCALTIMLCLAPLALLQTDNEKKTASGDQIIFFFGLTSRDDRHHPKVYYLGPNE